MFSKRDGFSFPVGRAKNLYLYPVNFLEYLEAKNAPLAEKLLNMDFVKEVCKDCAWYFNPYSLDDIVNVIHHCITSEDLRKEKIMKGKEMMKKHPQWDEIFISICHDIEFVDYTHTLCKGGS